VFSIFLKLLVCVLQKPASLQKPTHSSLQEDTWNRLTNASTVASAQKEACCDSTATIRDSLDFALKTEYDQHHEFLKDKSDTLLQKETLTTSKKLVASFCCCLLYRMAK